MGRKTTDKKQVTNASRLPPSELLRLMVTHGSSNAIKGMEAAGQAELVATGGASLPVNGSGNPCFAKMGIVFGETLDGVFREATLPSGWKIVPTEHSMWSDLVDAKGRKRAGIFYKAAFYDRRAEIRPKTRYACETEYQGDFGKVGESHRCFVMDGATGAEVFSTKTLRRETEGDRTFIKTEDLRTEATEWLKNTYPAHEDPAAYWD